MQELLGVRSRHHALPLTDCQHLALRLCQNTMVVNMPIMSNHTHRNTQVTSTLLATCLYTAASV